MAEAHKIKRKIEIDKFLEQLQEYEEKDIGTSYHTFFRFSKKQREIYNESFVKELLFNQTPFLVGIQNNNLWALFYKYEKEIWRIIIDIQIDKIYIVTFYKIDEWQIPKI